MPSSSVVYQSGPSFAHGVRHTCRLFHLLVFRTSCCSAGALSKAYDRGLEAVPARKPASVPAKYGT